MEQHRIEMKDENSVLSLIYKIFSATSMRHFQQAIEDNLSTIFNCERVTLVLVNRHK